MSIHRSAIVEAGAQIGAGAVVGPFCHIGPGVRLESGVVLQSHVVIAGRTTIGARTRVFPFVSIGAPSQDLKAGLAEGVVAIGEDCVLREGVTVNAGVGEGTRVGARCALLAQAHVAHDCRLGEGVVLANQALLGGHVEIGDHVAIGGGAAVHQHVRIGAHAFIGGLAGVEGDVIPFAIASGDRAHLFGINVVGLTRRGFDNARIARLRETYRRLFGARDPRPFAERLDALAADAAPDADAVAIVSFLRARGQRPLCAPRARA
jgi:UDP-N-acetylglucosamine acyltransferase